MKPLRILAVVFLGLAVGPFMAAGATLTVLHSFNSADGQLPHAALVPARDGNLYGVAFGGGTNGYNGTFFRITSAGTFTVLYGFTGGGDGGGPSGLIQGRDGKFYGTTYRGGTNDYCPDCGTVYAMTSAGTLTTIFSFFGDGDGANPDGPLVQGSDGYLYGTTHGSSESIYGTVFKLGGLLDFPPLWQFSGHDDGASPLGGLVEGSDGNYYGTTLGGPWSVYGTMFVISAAGELKSLHVFAGGSEGGGPSALARGNDGNFYGTTAYGGTNVGIGFGTVFKVTAGGDLSTLYRFGGGADGRTPYGALTQGSDGNFYGTTQAGGTSGNGTVFRISPAGTFTSLCSFAGGTGGATPEAGVVQSRDGNFYGTTAFGGTSTNCGAAGCGTIFQLVIPVSPPPNQISGIQLSGTNVVVTIPSIFGETYQLQYRDSLQAGGWANVGGAAVTNSLGGPLSLTNSGAALAPQRFYRFDITP